MDKMVNLGLLDECVLSASFNFVRDDPNFHESRGHPIWIQYDPVKNDYHYKETAWGEFGFAYQSPDNIDDHMGFPDEPPSDMLYAPAEWGQLPNLGFYYMISWPVAKKVNFFTWGGVYGNQPQPDTPWALQYWDGSEWVNLVDGIGWAWDDATAVEDTLWPYTPGISNDALGIWMSETPVTTNHLRFSAWSDGISPLKSYHIRARGGDMISNQDADNGWGTYAEDGTGFKSMLVQYIDVAALTAIGSDDLVQPSKFALHQNYPNPFNPQTNIQFVLPKAGHVKLSVYNVLGQEVAVLVNAKKTSGLHQVTFDAATLSSGVYYYRIKSDAGTLTKKMMVIK